MKSEGKVNSMKVKIVRPPRAIKVSVTVECILSPEGEIIHTAVSCKSCKGGPWLRPGLGDLNWEDARKLVKTAYNLEGMAKGEVVKK